MGKRKYVMKLWKTTIVIWSDYDPQQVELADIARDAQEGDAYCSKQTADFIEDVEKDPEWDGTEFFGEGDNDFYEEGNIPEGFEYCGCCNFYHKIGYAGDCRNDEERYVWDEDKEKDVLVSAAELRRRREMKEKT
jgi:hypothetical protein